MHAIDPNPMSSAEAAVAVIHGPAVRELMDDPFVYVLILNWNSWCDTIECLESVFRSDHRNFRVIVCDNDSTDGSLDHIRAWAEGRLDIVVPGDAALRHLSFPFVPKPIPFVQYDRAKAEAGGRAEDRDARLILVQTGANLGFAAGSNVGLRYAEARADFDYIWMLNPDTVVEPDALDEMLTEMRNHPDAGICGSTALYYEKPDLVQEHGGGRFFKWFGVGRPIGKFEPAGKPVDAARVVANLDYVSGTSLMISRACLRDTGLFSEDYFIYFEDIDWSTRARRRYALTFAPDSTVYHKKGVSSGGNSQAKDRSPLANHYLLTYRLLYTRKFFPIALPTVYLGLILTALNRLRLGRWDTVKMIFRIIASRGRQ